MTTIVSAVYGGFDEPRPQVAQDIDVDWVLFTDIERTAPPPWRVVVRPSAERPRLAAKVPKMCPDVDDTDVIWIDGSHQITSPTFAREALHARHDGDAVFKHPRRDCIYDEAEASVGRESQGGKYILEPLAEQVAAYRAEGHPEHAGLYACGTVAWDLTNPIAIMLGAAWLRECEHWSIQDQLSFPVVCRRLDVAPGLFPLPQIRRRHRAFIENRWQRIFPHVAIDLPVPG